MLLLKECCQQAARRLTKSWISWHVKWVDITRCHGKFMQHWQVLGLSMLLSKA